MTNLRSENFVENAKHCSRCSLFNTIFYNRYWDSLFFIFSCISKRESESYLDIWFTECCNFSLYAYYTCSLFHYSCLYFYIMCKYIRIKNKNITRGLIHIKKENKYYRIRQILSSYDSLYKEINEYNASYWSKFLLNIWLVFGSSIVILIFILIFANINIIMKLLLMYFTFIFVIIFNLILSNACSVNSESKKAYIIFNSIILEISRTKTNKRNFALVLKNKVK